MLVWARSYCQILSQRAMSIVRRSKVPSHKLCRCPQMSLDSEQRLLCMDHLNGIASIEKQSGVPDGECIARYARDMYMHNPMIGPLPPAIVPCACSPIESSLSSMAPASQDNSWGSAGMAQVDKVSPRAAFVTCAHCYALPVFHRPLAYSKIHPAVISRLIPLNSPFSCFWINQTRMCSVVF